MKYLIIAALFLSSCEAIQKVETPAEATACLTQDQMMVIYQRGYFQGALAYSDAINKGLSQEKLDSIFFEDSARFAADFEEYFK